jgi:hypothetical protein
MKSIMGGGMVWRILAFSTCIILQVGSALADFASDFDAAVARGGIADAVSIAEARLDAAPNDGQAQFALGAARFLQAVNNLGYGFYRYGLNGGGSAEVESLLPFLRLPLPQNPHPEAVTYTGLRTLLSAFVADLAVAEAALAKVSDAPVKLPISVWAIRLDFDGDNHGSDQERLSLLLSVIAGAETRDERIKVVFDESDVPWLRGYTHLLSAMAEIMLAFDWHVTFEQSFHAAFPNTNLPTSELRRESERVKEKLDRMVIPPDYPWGDWEAPELEDWLVSPEGQARQAFEESADYATYRRQKWIVEDGAFGDLLIFLRLIDWPVAEPGHLASARQHLLSMIALSRESWKRIEAETDDDQEWLPGPDQSGPFANMRVTDALVADWMHFLDGFEAVLEGRLLLPHWRFDTDRGLNVRRLMEEAKRIDLLMIVLGPGVLPFIEYGPVASGSTADTALDLLSDGMLGYFLWFN